MMSTDSYYFCFTNLKNSFDDFSYSFTCSIHFSASSLYSSLHLDNGCRPYTKSPVVHSMRRLSLSSVTSLSGHRT